MLHQLKRIECRAAIVAALFVVSIAGPVCAEGDPQKGARTFNNLCSPCHSVAPDRHLTGPSLAGIVNRKAGSVAGFDRYSKALPLSTIVWDEQTLISLLTNPQAIVSGTSMPGINADEKARTDIVAYLLATQTPGAPARDDIPKPHQKMLDLKAAGPATRIASIGLCRDTYAVKMENGTTLLFWEPNLRFKTDSSNFGPTAAKPVLVPTGMHGDRSYAIFASAKEISDFVKSDCPIR